MAINYGKLNAKLNPRGSLKARMGVSGPLNSDYEALINKPQINGNELIGNKTNEDLGIPTKTSDLDNDLNFVSDENYVHTDNNYDDTDKGKVDALGTASTKNVPAEGNASASEVVMGSDTRLTDSRNAKDVYDWAKAQTKPSYNYSEIQNTPAINNSTITIQKNNQNVDSFTLNQDSNKSINISVPTKTSDLQNDNSFITNTVNNLANYYLKTQTYTQTEVDALIQAAINGRFQKVNSLPASGEPNVIYLVPKTTPETSNACDEYIWQDNAWELIGSTEIDLSDYVTDEELATALQSYLTTSAFATAIANYYTKTEVGTLLDNKVDKVNGKGLSTYDYDATAKAIVDSVTASLAAKVDKVAGKGLSTNDYDNTAKGIVDGVTAALADKVDKVEGKGLSTNDYTTAEKDKLGGIANNATKVESSNTNGNIKINNTETQVYDDTLVREAISDLNDDVEDIQGVITTDTTSASGNPLSFGTKSAQNAINPIVTLEPIQAGSGTPSPDNVRPISGYDKIEVLGCGKNLFNPSTFERGLLNQFTGVLETATAWITSDYVKISGDATISGYKDGTEDNFCVRFVFYDKDKNFIRSVENINVSDATSYSRTITLDSNTRYVRASFGFNNKTTTVEAFFGTNRVQLEENNQVTTYEPYHKTTDLSENLPQTVYGGTLDVENGVLRVDHETLSLASMDWGTTNTGQMYTAGVSRFAKIVGESTDYAKDFKLNCFNAVIGSDVLTNIGDAILFYRHGSYTGYRLFIKSQFESTSAGIDAFKQQLTDYDAKICYELADEYKTEIQLTPTEIELLKGYNYLSTNGTTISLDYRDGEMATLGDVLNVENKLQEEIDNPISYDGKNYRLGMDATGLYLYNITDDTKAYIQMVSE